MPVVQPQARVSRQTSITGSSDRGSVNLVGPLPRRLISRFRMGVTVCIGAGPVRLEDSGAGR